MTTQQTKQIEALFIDADSRRETAHCCVPGQGLLRVPRGRDLVMTVDTLVEGVHFLADTPACAVGHKALAVNLSDLAAMGAQPAWVTVVLTLPELDARDPWLMGFRDGLRALAENFGVEVLAVKAVPGVLSITIQAYGLLPACVALTRAGAKAGDRVYVTGTLGDAGLALAYRLSGTRPSIRYAAYLNDRLDRPQPRVAAGLALHGIASAAIDLSDGLAADLGHILEACGVGATLQVGRLPVSSAMRALADPEQAWQFALGAGDDYELCFTVPEDNEPRLGAVAAAAGLDCTRIGVIEARCGLRFVREDGEVFQLERHGYDHFRTPKPDG